MKVKPQIINLLLLGVAFVFVSCGGSAPKGVNTKGITSRAQRSVFRGVRTALRQPFLDAPSKGNPLEQEIMSGVEIIGQEPSWLIGEVEDCANKYYLNLLTAVQVGEYDINPQTGGSRNPKPLEESIDTLYINCLKENNPELDILLHATMYGDHQTYRDRINTNNYSDFLESNNNSAANARRNFRNSVNDLVNTKGWFNGVVIDFPNLPRGLAKNYVNLLKSIREVLDRNNDPRFRKKLYLRIPPIRTLNDRYLRVIQQVRALEGNDENPIVDGYIQQAYFEDLAIMESPSIPIESDDQVIGLDTVAAIYKAFDLAPIYEFSYIGLQRRVVGNKLKKTKAPYRVVSELIEDKSQIEYRGDKEYAEWRGESGESYLFENEVTLKRKYEWILSNKGRGVALAGMSYGGDGTELWEAIGDVYGQPPPQLVYPIIAFVLMFFGIGIGWSVIRYWQVRNLLARPENRALLIYTFLALGIFVVLTFWAFFWNNSFVSPKQSTVLAAVVLGGLILFPVLRRMLGSVRRFI